MTEQENIPKQQEPEPKLTWEETFPEDCKKTIGKNNLRVNFHKNTCNESSCLIVVDALLYHLYKSMLTKSASVLEFYIHQFWNTSVKILSHACFTSVKSL